MHATFDFINKALAVFSDGRLDAPDAGGRLQSAVEFQLGRRDKHDPAYRKSRYCRGLGVLARVVEYIPVHGLCCANHVGGDSIG